MYNDKTFQTVDGVLYRKNYYSAEAPITIDDNSRVNVAVDNDTITLNDSKKLKLNYSATKPLSIDNATERVSININNDTMAVNSDNKLQAKQGVIVADEAKGISVSVNDENKQSSIAVNTATDDIVQCDDEKGLYLKISAENGLSTNSDNNVMSVNSDNVTIGVVNNKLAGKIQGVQPISVTGNKVGLQIDESNAHITADGKLSTDDVEAIANNGVIVDVNNKDESKIVYKLNPDNTTVKLNSKKQLSSDMPTLIN